MISFSFILVLLLFYFNSSYAWNSFAYNAVCTIAQYSLYPSTIQSLSSIIPSGILNKDVCNWSASVENKKDWLWSYSLHYALTPDWNCTYIQKRDCKNNRGDFMYCIDGGIQNYTNRLLSLSSSQIINKEESKQDLEFLVNLVADATQPFNSGFHSDQGGKSLFINYFNQSFSLFDLWDNVFIKTRLESFNQDETEWIKWLIDFYQPNINPNLYCVNCSDIWLMLNTQNVCSFGYRDVLGKKIKNNDTIDLSYYMKSITIIETQIVTAGLRLANLLNFIFNSF